MNQAHLHLLLTHLPIIGALLGTLTLAAGYLLKNDTVKRTALGLFAFAALSAIPTFLTGEGAEEVVEDLPGVGENLIERHEETATAFIWLVGALGLLALTTLAADLRRWSAAKPLYLGVALLALVTTGVAAQTGLTGGEIRHTEARGNVAQLGGGQENHDTVGDYQGHEEEDEEDDH